MQTANSVFVTRKFNCSASELFDWLVQPNLVAKWFGPKHLSVGKVQTDIRVGGKYSIELKRSDGQSFFIEGRYYEINAPSSLTFSLHYEGVESAPPNSTVKIKLVEITQNESLLSLVQEFEYTPADMEGRTKAWEHMLQELDELLRTSS